MAKLIKLTPDVIESMRQDFEKALNSVKLTDGKFTFSKSFGNVQRKATAYYTEIAWLKMQTLIREFDKEVAWHGVAFRGDDPEKDEYIIKDILVYPQEVTGATVTTDQEKYQTWLMSHDDDVFNNIRMQGHSHVNMAVSPSSVDTALYEKLLYQLDDTMFYIFLIYNKKGEKTYLIYDMAKNVLFETADVTVGILDDGSGLSKFLQDAKEKVIARTYTQASTSATQPKSPGYYGYGSSYYSGAKQTPAAPPAPAPAKQPIPITQVSSKGKEDEDAKKGLHRKGKQQTAYPVSKEYDDRHYDSRYYGFDDDDDPYGPFGSSKYGYGYYGYGRGY